MYVLDKYTLKDLITFKTIGIVEDEDTFICTKLMELLDANDIQIYMEPHDPIGDDLVSSLANIPLGPKQFVILTLPNQPSAAGAAMGNITTVLKPYGYRHDGMMQALYTVPERNISTVLRSDDRTVIAARADDKGILYMLYTIIASALLAKGEDTFTMELLNFIQTSYKVNDIEKVTAFRSFFNALLTPEYMEEMKQIALDAAFNKINTFMSDIQSNTLTLALDRAKTTYDATLRTLLATQKIIQESQMRLYAIAHGLDDTGTFGNALKEAHEDGLLSGYNFDTNNNILYITVDSYLTASSDLASIIRRRERDGQDGAYLSADILKAINEGKIKIPVSSTIQIRFTVGATLTINEIKGDSDIYNMSGDIINRNSEWNMRNVHITNYNCFSQGKGQIKRYFLEGKMDQLFVAASEAIGNFNFYDADVAPDIHKDIRNYLVDDGLIKIRTPEGWQVTGGNQFYDENTSD